MKGHLMDVRHTEFVVFDVETTGLDPLKGDRIIEIAAVKIKNFKTVDSFESLVNPRRPLSVGAQKINQISQQMVDPAPTADEVLPHFLDFIGGACLAAHNAKFDVDFVCYELSLAGRRMRDGTPVLDTIKMARDFLPQMNNYRLSSLAHFLGLNVDETHRALADARLTAAALNRLLQIAIDKGMHDLRDLLKQFGVNKPNFKIEPVSQDFLF